MMSTMELLQLWETCHIKPDMLNEIGRCATTILQNWIRYKAVGDKLGIPAYVVGCIHYREASFDFQTHLANGDPLFDHRGNPIPTVHVPAGLIASSWEEGAIAAFVHEGWGHGFHWDLANALQNMHSYNGWGPEKHGVNSSYVWGGTDKYTKGMYVADGQWNAEKTDGRPGCAAILLALKAQGVALNEVTHAV